MINVDKPLLHIYNAKRMEAAIKGLSFPDTYEEWRELMRERAKEKKDD